MQNKNILFLSAGRRVELVQLFKKAIHKYPCYQDSKIIGADNQITAPALYFCDRQYTLPSITDTGYLEEILKICEIENIGLIIPTIDTELLIIASNITLFTQRNIFVNISSIEVIEICRNKIRSAHWFMENHFKTPQIITTSMIRNHQYQLPLFIKPLDGSSSINAFKINTKEELLFFIKYIKNPIIQEYIEGIEYTIDAFVDTKQKIISIVPRKRLATRSGEISKGQIIKDRTIINSVTKLLTCLKPLGHITIQCIVNDTGIYYIEINPRYGGGAPMSIMAGANTPLYWLKIVNQEPLFYTENYKEGQIYARYDQCIEINESL